MNMRVERQVLFWLAALLALVVMIGVLKDVLLPFIVGVVIAYALNPIVERLMLAGLSRTVASALILALGLIVGVLALLIDLPNHDVATLEIDSQAGRPAEVNRYQRGDE